MNKHCYSLTYLDSFNIKNKAEGLLEPSGLVLSHGGNALWTVSDDTHKVFKISLTGQLKKKKSFMTADTELEGITLLHNGQSLLLAKESNNELIIISTDTQKETDRKRLDEMSGYETIAHFFVNTQSSDTANKGLEGVAWNQKQGTIFAMKEGNPGLLMEISSDLKCILNHRVLDADNGFYDTDVNTTDMDFSDLCYDHSIDCFWIISDQARRLFLYDWQSNKVIQSLKLSYGHNGHYKAIKKAEGIAIDRQNNRLYIVSDETARLYIFDLR